MSAINSFETALLNLIFKNTDLANIGDATGLRGSTTAGSFWVALYTAASDLEAGTMTEANYTGYARVAVARGAGFTVAGNNVENAAAITFGACTAGTNTVTHWALMSAVTGGTMFLNGSLGASLAISAGITPEIAAGAMDITVD